MNKVFIDSDLNESFINSGYCVLKGLLSRKAIGELHESYKQFTFDSDAAFVSTNYSDDTYYRKQVFETLDRIITPGTAGILNDYVGLSGAFFNKKARKESRVGMHLDWQLVNEPEHIGLNLWTPLVATNRWNGCLKLIPGTHKGNPMFRGPNYTVPQNLMKHPSGLKRKAKRFYVNPGDAVVYDNRLIHFSGNNRLWRDRPAVSFLMVPASSQPVHFFFEKDADGNDMNVRKYTVDPDFYSEHCRFKQENGVYRLSDGLPDRYEDVTEESAERLKQGIDFLDSNFG